ncbi:MAG: putative toxin-antitoxin system toxin component, PIN family [Bacteroidales bacterium]|nr:putative toxin-antitoxin system toxin component, PIN family [Bacteroidales bacterium]MBR4584522.1 putative toxin-antitoxin system toxin component, PIN family [Bacteroidales bacterium]
MKVILDCNIWISFLIGHQTDLIRKILTDIRFDVYVCSQLMEEINDVANRDKIRKYVAKNDLEDLFRLIAVFCKQVTIDCQTNATIRDPKDLYLLSFAECIGADYIVSGDLDVLDIHQHNNTRMIKLSEFKQIMQY